jgi:hypothetical protein
MVQLDDGSAQDVDSFGEHVKGAFGASWKEELCDGHVVEGEIGVGSPALLVISLAALRSLELLRYQLFLVLEQQCALHCFVLVLLEN